MRSLSRTVDPVFFPSHRYLHLGLRGAVRRSQRADLRARGLLRVLAQRGGGPHPDPDSRGHGRMDHEHLLGNGHGHPGKSVTVHWFHESVEHLDLSSCFFPAASNSLDLFLQRGQRSFSFFPRLCERIGRVEMRIVLHPYVAKEIRKTIELCQQIVNILPGFFSDVKKKDRKKNSGCDRDGRYNYTAFSVSKY